MIIDVVDSCSSIYKKAKGINENEQLTIYYKSYSTDKIYTYYYNNFCPFLLEKADRIIKNNINMLIDKYALYTQIVNTIDDYIFNYVKIPDALSIRDVTVKLFLGLGTCEAFPTIDRNRKYINIAIENYLNLENPLETIVACIIHELCHLIRNDRELTNNKATTLGSVLVKKDWLAFLLKSCLKSIQVKIKKYFH
jgi:hypothetical protein